MLMADILLAGFTLSNQDGFGNITIIHSWNRSPWLFFNPRSLRPFHCRHGARFPMCCRLTEKFRAAARHLQVTFRSPTLDLRAKPD